MHAGSSDEELECYNEIWDAVDGSSDANDKYDIAPKLPTMSLTSADEEIKAKGIMVWTTGFFISL